MKTSHILIGTAIVVGAIILYRKKKISATSQTSPTPIDTLTPAKIPLPQSEATKIVNLPDSLLQNTSGNTGIIPPVIKQGSTPVKVGIPLSTPIFKQTNLQGYVMN